MSEDNAHTSDYPMPPRTDPWAAVNKPATCNPGGRRPDPPMDLKKLVQDLDTHVMVTRLQADASAAEDVAITQTGEERKAFVQTATDWELANSRLAGKSSNWSPLVDEGNVALAYVRRWESTGVYFLEVCDIAGGTLSSQTTGEKGLEDSVGNDIAAAIVTLGGAVVVKTVGKAIAGRIATGAIGRGVTAVAVSAARLGGENAVRATLLALRGMRARAIVAGLRKAGAEVVVNIGGEAGPAEVMRYGAGQIALNDAVRISVAKRFIPNLVKEPGEKIGEVFAKDSVDRVVSRMLDQGFDVDQVAQGVFKVLKSGGKVEMDVFSHDPVFAARFNAAMTRAGLRVSPPPLLPGTSLPNYSQFFAVKP